MSLVTDKIGSLLQAMPRRKVSIKRDGQDFLTVFEPENIVAFRNEGVKELRKACHWLRYEIINDPQ
jgi:hypothetical protein